MTDQETTIAALRDRISTFVQAREWDRFHNPKDLSSAIAIEASELMELLLWKNISEIEAASQEPDFRQRMEEELADVVILCLSLANRMGIDVSDAVVNKLAVNDAKYPVDVVRGRSHKYTHYMDQEGC